MPGRVLVLLPRFTIAEASKLLGVPARTLRRRVSAAGIANVGTPARPRYRWLDLLDAAR